MYLDFFNLSRKPFSIHAATDHIYLGENHGVAAASLEYGILENPGFIVMSGEIGTGKTTLVRHVLNQVGGQTVVAEVNCLPSSRSNLIEQLCAAFGVSSRDVGLPDFVNHLSGYIDEQSKRGKSLILFLDDAQNLSADDLEAIRLIVNFNDEIDKLITVLFVGQTQLRRTIRKADLAQFRQRISVHYHLDALTRDETGDYIRFRLDACGGDANIISPDAVTLIHQHADGLPRVINAIADLCLVYAFSRQQAMVDSDTVSAVVRDRNRGGIALQMAHLAQNPLRNVVRVAPFRNRFANDNLAAPDLARSLYWSG